MFEFIKYLILGIIQGITEPIPVSSSGHILVFKQIIENLTKVKIEMDYTTFATITNLGSLVAVTIIFRKDIMKIFTYFYQYLKTKDEKYKVGYNYFIYVVIGTIPAGIAGLLVTKLKVLDALEENIKFLGLMLIVTAVFLYIIKDFKGDKSANKITIKDAIIIGLFQMLAIIPGISRSGSTIVGGMFRGLKRETAFRFSFILYIPISVATSILGISKLFSLNINLITWLFYLVAAIMAFIFTLIFTKWFKKIVEGGKLIYFSIYCLIVGVLIILFL